MDGNNYESVSAAAPALSVREAAIKLLADLDAQRFDWDKGSAVQLSTVASIGRLRSALQNERSALLDIENPQLAAEGIELIKRGDQISADHIRAIVAAAEAAIANEASGAIRWDATIRAIKRWQTGEPSRPVVEAIGFLRAIRARRAGEFDHPDLVAFGPLGGTDDDMTALAEKAERALLASIEGVPAGQRELIWPDHVDLLVWLLELVELQPACPSVHAVEAKLRTLRTLFVASPVISEAADMIEGLANALVASSRRTVIAETMGGEAQQILGGLLDLGLQEALVARARRWLDKVEGRVLIVSGEVGRA